MKNIYKTLSISSLILFALPVLAQLPGPPPATPIDGGLSILLAAGGAYGVKKIRDARKEK